MLLPTVSLSGSGAITGHKVIVGFAFYFGKMASGDEVSALPSN